PKRSSISCWIKGERQQALLNPAFSGPSSMRGARAAMCVGVSLGGRPVGFGRGAPWIPSQQNPRTQAATVFSCTRKTTATSAKLRPSPTARMARRYLTWRQLPCCWAVFSRPSTALRECVVRVKRTLHIGTFLQRHHGSDVSLVGIFPMCGGASTHLQKIFFLKSIAS